MRGLLARAATHAALALCPVAAAAPANGALPVRTAERVFRDYWHPVARGLRCWVVVEQDDCSTLAELYVDGVRTWATLDCDMRERDGRLLVWTPVLRFTTTGG